MEILLMVNIWVIFMCGEMGNPLLADKYLTFEYQIKSSHIFHKIETNDNGAEIKSLYKITFQRLDLFIFKYYIYLTNKYKHMTFFSFLLENHQCRKW